MKTTVDIDDTLLREIKRQAVERHTTLKAVMEAALRQWLSQESPAAFPPFRLRRHTFRGEGLQADLNEGDWNEIRRRAYEGRGG